MEIKQTHEKNIEVLTLNGRLDSAGAPLLRAHLQRAFENGLRCLVLDLACVDYISSTGFRVLLEAAKSAGDAGGLLALSGLNPSIRDFLEMAGLLNHVPVFAETADALQQASWPCDK